METSVIDIPTALSDVKPAWLTTVLAKNFPGVEVQALRKEALHDGTAFTYRMHVTYREDGPVGPKTVCLKAGMEAPHRDFVLRPDCAARRR